MTRKTQLLSLTFMVLSSAAAAQTHHEAQYWGCRSVVEQYETSRNDRSTARSVYRQSPGPVFGGAFSTRQQQYVRGIRRSPSEPLSGAVARPLVGVTRTAPNTYVAVAVIQTPQGPQVDTLTMVLNVGARLVIQPFPVGQRITANCAFHITSR